MKRAKGINKYLGLMFKSRKTESLVFEFEKPVNYPIHSLFVFFKFNAIWTLEDGVKEIKTIKPFKGLWRGIRPSKPYIQLMEIPI